MKRTRTEDPAVREAAQYGEMSEESLEEVTGGIRLPFPRLPQLPRMPKLPLMPMPGVLPSLAAELMEKAALSR